MNVTLHQLKVFLEVAQYQSITRAAEALHLTQPAVSIQMRNLQEQFEIPLTELIGRQLYLTDFGHEVAEAARRILAEVSAVDNLAHSYKGKITGKLRISVVSTGKYVMPYFLTGFTSANEGVELIMDVTNRGIVLEHLAENLPDFALVSLLPDQLSIESEPLMANDLYLIGSPGLVNAQEGTAEDMLQSLPLIFREPGSATRRAMQEFVEQANVSVRRRLELTSNEAVKQAVIAGLGISVMPRIGIRQELKRGGLTIIPHPAFPISTTWNLIWLKGKQHSPAAAAFLQYIRQEKDHIIQQFFPVE